MWRKEISAATLIAFAVVLIVAISPVANVDGEEWTDDIQPLSTDSDNLKVEFVEDHDPISTSTSLDALKNMLIVQYNVDGSWQIINSDDYSLEIDTSFLTAGSDVVSISYNGSTYELGIDDISSNAITGITVDTTGLGDIYTSVSESHIKEKITVTVNFFDNTSVQINPDQYTISWAMSEWSEDEERMTFLVNVHYDYGVTETSFEYEMNALEIVETISAEWTQEEIQSFVSRSELASNFYFTVKATFNDGVERLLPYHDAYSGESFDFGVSGTTLSGEDKEEFTTTLNIYYTEDRTNYVPVKVDVKHIMPSGISAFYEGNRTYEAFTQVDTDGLTVILNYSEYGRTLTLDTSHYSVTYQDADTGPQSFRVPESGLASITVTVNEYGKPFTATVGGFTVVASEITRPVMDEKIQSSYTGDPYKWQIYNYDEDRMVVTVSYGASLIEYDGDWYIQATDAGTYNVSISPIDQSVKWNTDPQDPVEFSLTINGAEMTPAINITGDKMYTPDGISYVVSVTATGLDGTSLNITQDNVSYTYNGSNTFGLSSSGAGLPTEAGEWIIYATISNMANYQNTTVSESIEISKMVLKDPELMNYDYDMISHAPTLATASDIYSVSGDSQIYAGNYSATVEINDEHLNNYRWDSSDRSTIPVPWKIETAANSVTSSSIIGWTYCDEDSVDIKSILNSSIKVVTKFDTSYSIHLLDSETKEVVSISNGQYNAGSYYVKIIFDSDDDEDGNSVPNFYGFEWTSTDTITISPFKIDSIADAGSKDYQYDHQNGCSESQSSDLIDTKYYSVIENKSYSEAGTHNDAVKLKINSNYVWSDDQGGLQTDGTVLLAFTINAMDDNSVTMVWGGGDETWTYGGTDDLPFPESSSKYGPVVIYFWTDESYKHVWNDDNRPEDAGYYSFQATVTASTYGSYNGCNSDVMHFTINQQPVNTAPSYAGELIYNGSQQTVTTEMLEGWNELVFSIDGESSVMDATDHNSSSGYPIYIGLTSNYCWGVGMDGDNDGLVQIFWNIDKREIMLSSNLEGRTILISSGLSNPGYTIVDDNGSVLNINATPAWSTESRGPNTYHKGTLTLSNDDYANNYWIVNPSNNGSATDPNQMDSVDSSGKVLTIWYTFALNQYEIDVNIGLKDTYVYDGSQITFPDYTISILDDSSMTTDDKDSINEQFSSVYIYYTKDGSDETIDHHPKDVGTYTVHFVVPATDKFGSASWSKEFEIKAATIDANPSHYDVTYSGTNVLDGLKQTLNDAVSGVYANDMQLIEWTFFEFEGGTGGFDFIGVSVDAEGQPISRTVWYAVSAGDNYTTARGSFTVTVNPAILTVTLSDGSNLSKYYDGNEPDLTGLEYTADYKVDDADSLPVSFGFKAQNVVNAGEYDIVGSVDSENYVVVVKVGGSSGLVDARYSILKATLIDGSSSIPSSGAYVTYEIDLSQYDGTERSFSVVVNNYGDENNNFTINVTYGNGVDNVVNAGEYDFTITIKSSYDDSSEGNYEDFTASGTIEIPQRDIQFEFVDSVDVYYGEPLPSNDIISLINISDGYSFADHEGIYSFGYSLSLSSDDYTVSSNAGIGYSIKQIWTLNEGAADNYNITGITGTLVVDKRPVVVTFNDGINKSPYGLTVNEINERINSEESLHVTSGVEGLSPFVNGHAPSEVFRLYINIDGLVEVPNVDEYEVKCSLLNSNYDVTVRNSATDSNSSYNVYAATLKASLVTSNLIYDTEEQDVSVRFEDSNGNAIEAPSGVEYHISYYYNYGSELIDSRFNPIIDAGKYDVRVIVDNTENYTVELTSAVIDVLSAQYVRYNLNADESIEYTGKPLELSIRSLSAYGYNNTEFDLTNNVVVRYYSDESRNNELESDDIVDADVYYVTISVTSSNHNYSDFKINMDFEITPARVTPVIDSIYYDGEEHNLKDLVTMAGISGNITEYSVNLSDGSTTVKNADTYEVHISLNDSDYNSNYEIAEGCDVISLVVRAIPIVVTLSDSEEYSFGELTVNNLSEITTDFEVVLGSAYTGNLTANVVEELFKDEDYEFIATIRASTAAGGYIPAGTYADALGIEYNGHNFDATFEESNIKVDEAVLDVTIPNYSISYNPDGMSINSRIDYSGEDYGQTVSVNVILKDNITLTHVGTYALTATVTNSNFRLNIIAAEPDEKDGVQAPYLEVVKASNYWIETNADVDDWDYKEHLDIDGLGIKWPQPLDGTVVASIYGSDNSSKFEFTEDSIPTDVLSLPVGMYYIIFKAEASVNGGYTNYEDIAGGTGAGSIYQPIRSDFEIHQFELSVMWDPKYVQYEEGQSHEVVLKGLENYQDVTIYVGDLDSEHPHWVDADGNIMMSASELGTYGVSLILDDPNYCWADSDGTTIDVFWRIGHSSANSWEVQPQVSERWQYGDEPDVLIPGDALYGDVITLFYNRASDTLYGEDGTTVPAEPGQYYMRSYVVEADGSIQLDARLNFDIIKRTLPVPEVIDDLVFSYESGETVLFNTNLIENYAEIEQYVVLAGNEANEPGNYTLVISISDTTCCEWADVGNALPVFIKWTVSEGGTLEDSMFVVDMAEEVFSGHPIQKDVTSTNLIEGEDYVVSYANNISAGTASIVITGIGAYSGQLQYEFQIQRASEQPSFYNEALTMYVEDDAFYNAVQIPAYVDSSKVAYVSSDSDIATVDSSTGAIVMNATGTVTITAYYAGTDDYTAGTASYELTVSDHPVEVVDHVVYVKVPVTVPDDDDDDDQTDDKPETVYIEKDNDLYIWLLIVMAVICVCFAAYILYSHRDQEGGA